MWKTIALFGLLFLGCLALAVWIAAKDQEEWQQYSAEHHCITKGTKRGQVGVGITSGGKSATTFTPDQTIYQCDAGELVIR